MVAVTKWSATSWILVILLALGGLAAGAMVLVRRAGVPAGAIGPNQGSPFTPALVPPEIERARDEATAAAAEPRPVDAETFLAQYWGEEWPRIEAALRGKDGWADFDLSKLPLPPPREVAIPKLREHIAVHSPDKRYSLVQTYMEIGSGSGDLKDRSWIQSKYSPKRELSEADFSAIDATVGPAQQILEASANQIVDAIYDAKVSVFDRGDLTIAPYSTTGGTNVREGKPGLLYSGAWGWEGWGAAMMVLESDVPGFAEMRAENILLIQERNRVLKEIIATF